MNIALFIVALSGLLCARRDILDKVENMRSTEVKETININSESMLIALSILVLIKVINEWV